MLVACRKKGLSPFSLRAVLVVALAAVLIGAIGCESARPSPHGKIRMGRYAEARDMVEQQVVDDRSDRRYMLDRMRAGVLNLDAGDPDRAEMWFAEVYDVLRLQGLNADKTVASVVLTEGVKVWKGEPFEQAMALVYYGYVQASNGSWDNARAAASNALFYLRDFDKEGGDGTPERIINTAEIAERAARYEAQQRGEDPEYASGDEYLDNGYIVERNNFTMAYLLHAIASQQLGRDAEASDYFNRAQELNGALVPLVKRLRAGDYNTIVVIADGLGPRKVATGPGGSLSRYRPLDAGNEPAVLRYAGKPEQALPVVTNLNAMARDHRWNNLEDVRVAKNTLGDLSLIGGGIVRIEAAEHRDGLLAIIGAGLLGLGLLFKGTAVANTDYCDVFPQRMYVAALTVEEPGHELIVDLPNPVRPVTVRLTNLAPPLGPEAKFIYVRAPVVRDMDQPPPPAPLP